MKPKFVIATATAAAVIGGGTLVGVAAAGDGGSQSAGASQAAPASQSADSGQRSSVQLGPDSDDRSDVQENTQKSNAAKVSAADAARAALGERPGTVTGIDLEDEDGGGLIWEIDVLGKDGKWHDVDVDPGNGKVLNQHTDQSDEHDHGQSYVRQDLKGTSVDAATAAEKASAQGKVTSVDLEDGDHAGQHTGWEVDAVNKHGAKGEFVVDAHTGKVTKSADDDSDDDGDHGDSDHADHDDHGDHDGHDKGDDHEDHDDHDSDQDDD